MIIISFSCISLQTTNYLFTVLTGSILDGFQTKSVRFGVLVGIATVKAHLATQIAAEFTGPNLEINTLYSRIWI